jgi:hypothetical protein
MRQIRASFAAKKAEIGKPGFTKGVMQGVFGKKTVGKMNAMEREALRKRQYEVLSPYESVIQIIDEALVELDRLKMQLEAVVARHE